MDCQNDKIMREAIGIKYFGSGISGSWVRSGRGSSRVSTLRQWGVKTAQDSRSSLSSDRYGLASGVVYFMGDRLTLQGELQTITDLVYAHETYLQGTPDTSKLQSNLIQTQHQVITSKPQKTSHSVTVVGLGHVIASNLCGSIMMPSDNIMTKDATCCSQNSQLRKLRLQPSSV
ncbi:hypothetical protein Tco_1080858 [Tanacetum coccineum]|uniref:Uncharacterized protein n=1 Tax=Tanacetum coccineum TaxID=301880 RepID=A0ABQ5HW00_9ASTR